MLTAGCAVAAPEHPATARQAATSASLASDPRGYALVTTLELVKPIDVAAMTDDFQQARLVSENDRTATVEVRVYPLVRPAPIDADPDWRVHDHAAAALAPYLAPGPTANFDDAMRAALVAALRADGIDPDRLDDRELVGRVAAWLFSSGRFAYLDDFVAFDVVFDRTGPHVDPSQRVSFERHSAALAGTTDGDKIAMGVLGKRMFEAREHGDCTASAILATTVLRALGIPTRMILTVPVIDGNDAEQRARVAALRHGGVRRALERGVPRAGWASHTLLEVFVGGHWVRLNYARLGQPPLDAHYLGVMVKVATLRDWGESPLGARWGEYVEGAWDGPRLSSRNPYRSLALRDELAPGAHLDLSVPATLISRVLDGDARQLPATVAASLRTVGGLVLVTDDIDPDYKQHGLTVTLRAAGVPDVVADVAGDLQGFSPEIDGYVARPRQPLRPGVTYRIVPSDPSWQVNDAAYKAARADPSR